MSGKAGRCDYGKWDKVAKDLVSDVEKEDLEEIEEQKRALGLDGKYARSADEKAERQKAEDVKKTKQLLDRYQNREKMVMAELKGLLGPSPTAADDSDFSEERKSADPTTVRITRDTLDAGKRVITIADTSGNSLSDCIVLTQDLSHLESKMSSNTNPNLKPKTYEGDAENDVVEPTPGQSPPRVIYGLIKAFITHVENCTIHIKCKIISGTIELSHCKNVTVCIHKDATVATIQADLCEDITIDFRDAPSSKNTAVLPGQTKMYWGEDKDDRIFHAGVKNMRVRIFRDDFMESETLAHYLNDGAEKIGNATAEEMQFVTSVVGGKLLSERVIRAGGTTGRNVRAMTQREMDEEEVMREKAAAMAIAKAEDIIRFEEKNGNSKKVVKPVVKEEEKVQEVYASMSADEIKTVVDECDQNKARGNEAFQAGEYGQAILLYSLSLDKAEELPDKAENGQQQLFRRDLVLSNRAACFLKLGQHEKALEDAKLAQEIEPANIKAIFRRGLSLHAMGLFQEAIPILAEAHKLEPKNKQIKQALQFAEVRMTQEMRKRNEQ